MARRKIGELLVERGLITSDQLAIALAHQRQYGNRLGAALVAKRFVTEDQLLAALGEALAMPVVDPSGVTPDWTAVHLLRPRFCEVHELFPVALDEHGDRKVLTVAMADPLNTPAIEEIEFTTRCKVIPAIASRAAIHRAIKRWYMRQPPPQTGPDLPDGSMMLVRPGGDTEVVDTRTASAAPAAAAAAPAANTVQNVAVHPEALLADRKPAANGARKPQRAELLDEIARRSSVDDDLGFLFGLEEPSDGQRIEQLERRFLALLKVLHEKGALTAPEVKKLLGK
jgi:hypothetical protein